MFQPRTPYSPIIDRPPLRAPDGTRLIVHLIVNVEDWSIEKAMPRTALPPPQGVTVIPDVANYAWAEYGMRVGFWRIYELLEKYGIKPTLSINANVCNTYPQIAQRAAKAGWEMMPHGFIQRAMNLEEDERAVIRRAVDEIERHTGQRARGWLGPGLCETWETLDHLRAEGLEYVCDWGPMDEQPVPLQTSNGTITAIPYPVDMNDIVLYAIALHRSDELFERGCRQFDTLYAESETNARVMAVALHPYLSGVPHRIGYLDKLLKYMTGHPGVTFMRGGEILDWYTAEAGVGTRT
ncbi:MAG TPA: polysaccharide deacetylase family protein [Candidatus Acidoferrum sp.]|jgi:peptidoglycan/xylan/chitin deacetylase (PgdA/CDA1 family)|nr:polysaccharide deacetylase family protein [Candidatus Acidoferrum sp.]